MNGLVNPSTTTKNIGSFSLCSTLPADRGSMADRQTGRPAELTGISKPSFLLSL